MDDVLNRYQTVTAPTETVSNTTIRQSNENQNACAAIKNLFESLSLKKPLKLTNQFVHDEISSSVPAPSSIENSKAIAEKVISIEPTKIDPFGFVMRASGTEKKKSSSSSSSTTEPPVIPEAQPVAPVPDRILQNVKENIQNRSSEADSTTGSLPKKRKKYRSPIFGKFQIPVFFIDSSKLSTFTPLQRNHRNRRTWKDFNIIVCIVETNHSILFKMYTITGGQPIRHHQPKNHSVISLVNR